MSMDRMDVLEEKDQKIAALKASLDSQEEQMCWLKEELKVLTERLT